ncbi:MAG: HDOD domain-containing protein [Spirochaetaceae bacterium]|jgi:putative nucleotidyltransferase with HDIG domain|nr:HDOD domain-containing protein [Spirochaetaceae bacterium]
MAADIHSKIEEYIKTMPSLPTSVAKVLEVCNNPQTSPADLNHVISLDPVLVGRVLKLINSAYYGLGQQVTSLVRAIIMLGINTVKNLALSSAVLGNLSSNKTTAGLNMEGFWRHSLCVGVAAKIIAKKRGVDIKQAEEYFTAGLLHDIGKIALNAVLANDYMLTISASDRERLSLVRMEDRNLGINHCTAGAMIVRAWKLEGAVGDAIIYHHNHLDYEDAHKDVLYTIILANRFASEMEIGFSGDRRPEKPGPSIWEFLGIDSGIFEEIPDIVSGEIEKAEVFLKLQG